MEYLNDEMDDLFRKAGEHYPLKTSDSDWDTVLGRLQPAAGDQNPVDGNEIPTKRNNKNRRFFWLLLLLPLGLFSIKYFSTGHENRSKGNTGHAKISALNEATDSTSAGDQQVKTRNQPDKASARAAMPAAHGYPAGNGSLNGLKNKSGLRPSGNVPAKQQIDRPSQVSGSVTKPSATDAGTNPDNGSANNSGTGQDYQSTRPSATGNKTSQPVSAATDSGAAALPNTAGKPVQTDSAKEADKLLTSNQKSKKTKRISTQKEKGIYISILASPDFSMVKFQSVKSMGYGFGLLAGYRFNRHISMETGVYWDKKQYYSDGEYFDKSKTGIPYSVKIKDIYGNCGMFEIPLSFRYDFAFSRKGRFFSTAGLNSYIMKKENYDYSTNDYPGWSRKVSYNNSSNNLFSILELSAGYEYKLGKIGRIRVEPYLNIPLKGVGIGSMPISSAGLHLGITIPFR